MKTNGTQTFLLSSILLISLFTPLSSLYAQPEYYFKKPVLESGVDLAEGSVYRFSDVKPGVDALVDVIKFHGGVMLSSIDENWTGFDEAFQPFIYCPPGTDGYVEFQINFVKAGSNILMKQIEVPVTPIDIDGGLNKDLFEQDQIKIENGYVNYDLLGTRLDFKFQGGGWVKAKDITGEVLNGIDTTEKQAMFTVVNGNVDNIKIKMGANNQDGYDDDIRYRSVYFKKFTYNNALLSTSALKNFNGYAVNNQVNLQGTFESNHLLNSIIIERKGVTAGFAAVGEVALKGISSFAFIDNTPDAVNYYRLKMTGVNGQVSYSNVLMFRMGSNKKEQFNMYPSVINDNATVNISANKSEQTSLQLVDLNGHTVYQKKIVLQQGDNNVAVNGFSSVRQGIYVAVVQAGNTTYSQKIIIQ